tara:strand:+ start:4961 stop:5353 length:393 start_codon:yes stop_codon:yes gene_type:complete
MEQQQNQAAPNRRQRRAYLKQQGIIKALSKMQYNGEVRSKVRSENIAYGKKLHAENTARINELNATRLEAALDVAKLSWKEQGYNDAEVLLLEEAWALNAIKDKETYREDKKKRKQLLAQVKELRANRTK